MKKTWLLILWICAVMIFGGKEIAYAEDYSYVKASVPVLWGTPALDVNQTTIINWDKKVYIGEDEEAVLTHEVELSTNAQFIGAQKFETNACSLMLSKSTFGEQGGEFYVRVRSCVKPVNESVVYSDWSETQEYIFVAINEHNFPGLYDVLKNGGKDVKMDGTFEKVVYDLNGDGWLDPTEVSQIWSIETANETKKVKGKYKTIKATDVSSFKGVEYLTHLSYVHVERYSGKTADLSKCEKLNSVWISGITAKKFALNAPNVQTIHVEAADDNKMKKLDVSKCANVVDLAVYGNEGTKTLKLPKEKKKLKIVSLSDYEMKSVSLNAYTNLQQAYFYQVDTKNVKVNKCKSLRYIYFFCCDEIKSLNLKSNKKLRGADFYQTPGLTKSTVKKPKNGKYTWNKGKWWYGSSAYKKDMKNLYE